MGLDIYVGSLTRYYLRDWETVVQKYGREQGLKVQVVRPAAEQVEQVQQASPMEVLSAVTGWRSGLNESLSEHLSTPLDWREGTDGQYFTDKPAWDGYCSLLLLAAYDEHPNMTRPGKSQSDWSEDPAFKASTADNFKSQYSTILFPELWLPIPFNFVFRAPDVAGKEAWIGSSITLLQQLRNLNDRTCRGTPDQISQWRRDNFEKDDPFEAGARFGLAIFLELTSESAMHTLPMKLDY